jgi:hypothetical protein
MKWSKILSFCIFVLIFSGCSLNLNKPATTTTASSNPQTSFPTNQTASELAVTLSPTITPKIYTVDEATLFQQNLESGNSEGLHELYGDWNIFVEDDGNHALCNSVVDYWSQITIGNILWKNYAIEIRGKALEYKEYQDLTIDAQGVWANLNFQKDYAEIRTPDGGYSYSEFDAKDNVWYKIRLEVAGNMSKLFINDEQIGFVENAAVEPGVAGFGTSSTTKMCFDDVRVWALSSDGQIIQAPDQNLPVLEVITDNASISERANSWGGHQPRIVRTSDGVFTAFLVNENGIRKWQLAHRQEAGTWKVIAEDETNTDPPLLLASPDGMLHVIAWPNGIGTMWSGKLEGNQITMVKDKIPGMPISNYPYFAAGIDNSGILCVLATQPDLPNDLQWACYLLEQSQWINKTTITDYAHRYTYMFPLKEGGLSFVSTRDEAWSVLGYVKPPDAFIAVFNAIGYWHTTDIRQIPPQRLFMLEEKPTLEYPYPYLNAQKDAYLDTYGNLHILYLLQGESTNGVQIIRHTVLSPEGKVLADVQVPEEAGEFPRIFQDTKQRFWLLGSYGLLYPVGADGITLGNPILIIQDSHAVEYSGFFITVPRSGSPISDTIDVVFPTDNGKKWVYFQFTVPDY